MPSETVELSIYDESDKLYEGKFEVHFDWYQFAHDNGDPDADFELHTLIHAESGRCFSEDGIGSQVQDVENAVIDVIKERFEV